MCKRGFHHPSPLVAVLLSLVVCPSFLMAEDWSQWRGPNRDGKSTETDLLESWPDDGPPLVWKTPGAGTGYSAVSISQGRVFTMGNQGDIEYVIAFSLKDGKTLWRTPNGEAYRNNRGSGPRGTPTVDGAFVYALGANGDLSCLQRQDGEPVWQVNILEKFGGRNIRWGISESVLIEANMVICSPGGENACVVALDKKTGQTLWKSAKLSDPAGYASAVATTVGGVRQIVHFIGRSAAGLRARDGDVLWRYKRAANETANCATPIIYDNHMYLTSSYGRGCALLELSSSSGRTQAREVYFNKRMKNHHGGVVLVDGYVYGFSGGLVCMDFYTGEPTWTSDGPGKCSLIYADGHLYCLSIKGIMALVQVNPQQYVEKSRFVFKEYTEFKTGGIREEDEKPTWAHPVISHKKLFLRDQDDLYCYNISAS